MASQFQLHTEYQMATVVVLHPHTAEALRQMVHTQQVQLLSKMQMKREVDHEMIVWIPRLKGEIPRVKNPRVT